MEKIKIEKQFKLHEQQWFKEHSLTPKQFQELIQSKVDRAKRAMSYSHSKRQDIRV